MSTATTARFIVTTSASGQARSQVWNSELPLTLGHPLRWIAERTERGVRIRSLATRAGEISSQSVTEIPLDKLNAGKGVEVPLPQSKGMSIRIRPVADMMPAFAGRPKGDKLSIFACNGNWVLSSSLFEGRFQGRAQGKPVFSMRAQADTYAFDVHADGVTLRTRDEAARPLKQGEAAHVRAGDLVDTVLRSGTHTWRFGMSQAVELPAAKPGDKERDAENEWFRKALRGTVVAFGAFVIMTWLWPKPSNESKELVPAQFAKIVMAKQPPASKVKAQASEGNPTQAVANNAPEKVQKAAVVQAFRAKALSSAVSGLLKGGMTSLMAQSDFVAGRGATADARRMLDQRSVALASTGPTGAVAANTNQSVSNIGGTGVGKGAGYAKGERAGVKGQGQAFVSMDVAGAAVDEGLTKDEVGEVIHRHLSEVRYCYESAMIRTPDLEGKLMVNFTIGGNGVVKSTEIKSSTLPDPRLDDCIIRRLTTWKFPLPRGGIDVAVTYPFIFKTLGR